MTSLPTLDPGSTALVLVDLQRGIVALPTAPLSSAQVVANARLLAQAFRRKGALVVLVRVVATLGSPDALAPIADRELRPAGKPPEGFAEFAPEIGPEEGDVVIGKRQWGAFYGTDLDLQLRRRGMRTLVLGGIATNFGVESTARDAFERGYQLIFAADAMAGLAASDHDFATTRIFPAMGRVRNVAEIALALDGSWPAAISL